MTRPVFSSAPKMHNGFCAVSVRAESDEEEMWGVKDPPDMTTKTATERSMPPLPPPAKVVLGLPLIAPPPKVRRRQRSTDWAVESSSAEDTEPRDSCATRWAASKIEVKTEEEPLIHGATPLPIGDVDASDQNPALSSKAQASTDKPWNVPALAAARLQAEHARNVNV